MKNILLALLIVVLLLGAGIFISSKKIQNNMQQNPVVMENKDDLPKVEANNPKVPEQPSSRNKNPGASNFQAPLDRADGRITKKPFGIFITPENSPVQPEKFAGYHTGADFEIFPDETEADVSVNAVCSGKLVLKKVAAGYGGVVVEACVLDNQPITVVYGHLKLASISRSSGDSLQAGDAFGVLGAAYSPETSGERKHLHLGFHKGAAINILGYVSRQTDLSGWIDPCPLVCHN